LSTTSEEEEDVRNSAGLNSNPVGSNGLFFFLKSWLTSVSLKVRGFLLQLNNYQLSYEELNTGKSISISCTIGKGKAIPVKGRGGP
jgi:hypothetical protein